jgi:hypothetical protein
MAASVIERNRCDLFATQRVQEARGLLHIPWRGTRAPIKVRGLFGAVSHSENTRMAPVDPGVRPCAFIARRKGELDCHFPRHLQIAFAISGEVAGADAPMPTPRRGRVTSSV